MALKSYKDLVVWQKSIALVKLVYSLTKEFPTNEQYGLAAQMRRAAVSIPSNIAEGYSRKSRKEYIQFISIAIGSVAELETQLYIAKELGFGDRPFLVETENLLTEVTKMLYGLLQKIR